MSGLGDLDRRLGSVEDFSRLDLSGVTDIDTAGAWLAWSQAQDHHAEISGESEQARRLIAAVAYGMHRRRRSG